MNCLVGQSGGPTSVINSSLAGVIKSSIDNNFDKIYATLHGIEGFLLNNYVEIDKEKFEKEDIKEKLKSRPSSILGSCRFKLPSNYDDQIYKEIFRKFEELNITSFVYIGGNDSMDTVNKLNEYMQINNIDFINIVGCPKTIDNDLFGMDHSPGFGSASKYIINTIKDIRTDVDIYDIKTVTFVEIMGRNAGWLAASTLLANYKEDKKIVNLLYLSEHSITKEKLIQDIKAAHEKEDKNLIVVLSEGFMDTDNFFKKIKVRSYDEGFNHPIIAGISRKLSEYVYRELDIKTKAVELSITQRTNYMISKIDSEEAYNLGYKALEISLENTDLVPVINRILNNPYKVEINYVKSGVIANKEKLLPEEWFESKDVFYNKTIEYALPLIQGEIEQITENGMHKYINLKDIIIE